MGWCDKKNVIACCVLPPSFSLRYCGLDIILCLNLCHVISGGHMSLNCAFTKGERSLNVALNNLMSSVYPPFITKQYCWHQRTLWTHEVLKKNRQVLKKALKLSSDECKLAPRHTLLNWVFTSILPVTHLHDSKPQDGASQGGEAGTPLKHTSSSLEWADKAK